MMKILRLISIVTLIPCLFFPHMIYAQSAGKVAGNVVDAETGEPLIGANVIIQGTTLGAATDLDGTFVILQVPPGKYTVEFLYIGYQRLVMRDVQVLTDLTTELNVDLSSEVMESEEIVVIAEAPVIRKDLTSVEARVQAEDIERLPVQELGDILNLQAGITRDAGGALHIRGGRSTEVSYRLNGISITDDFSRTQAFQIENQSVQELQVISGTFNAEYGNAMSGLINIVTKTGGNRLVGDLELWSGDYISNRDDIFWNIDDVNPAHLYNIQGSLSGPVIKDKITFFVTGRRYYNDGWLYGPNAYIPQGRKQIINGDTVAVSGDSSAVAMNFRERWSGQGTLEWRIATPLKLKIDALGSLDKNKGYNHFYRLNPNGDKGWEDWGFSIISNLTHSLGMATFHEATLAYKYKEIISELYDNPFDSRYTHPDSLSTGSQQFAKAGTNLNRFKRYTQGWIAKYDFTSQISKRHLVKSGVELEFDEIYYHNINLAPAVDATGQQIVPFQTDILPTSSVNHDKLKRNPFKFAAYIQDKIEFESLIINLGLRFDLFDANGKIPADPEDPNIYNPFKLKNIYKDENGDGVIGIAEQRADNKYTVEEREAWWYKETSLKTQVSPRLGIGYPITETGVIHFSYGIFQQVPDYVNLYIGDELKVTSAAGNQGPYGNPDLNPERTTMYELGLKQQVSSDIGIDVTGFYRDIRDWISTSPLIPVYISGVTYVKYRNRDFANVKGLTLTVDKKFSENYSFKIDYTFSMAEGTNSDPSQEFYSQQGGAEPTKILTPLNWDQRHALNASLFVGSADWGVSLVSRFNSGQPYTPSLVTGTRTGQNVLTGLRENSRNKPNLFTVDLSAYKNFNFQNLSIQIFARIFNLLDALNPANVWTDTGLPDFTLTELEQAEMADDTWFIRPDYYQEPRRIQIGAKISIN